VSLTLTAKVACADYGGLSLSEDDLTLISRAVRAEAKEECYLVKVCVTSMILNRIKDELFPNDAASVVLERGAFRVADRRTICERVDDDELLEYTLLSKLVYENGIDPTCGALFCFTEGDNDADYFNVTIEVDGLYFAKP